MIGDEATTESDGRADAGRLFEKLISATFAHFACDGPSVPVIASLENAAGAQRDATPQPPMPDSWPRHFVGSLVEFPVAVQQLLAKGSVLLLPPWGRRVGEGTESRTRVPGAQLHEDVLLSCRPGPPGSILAALVPTSTVTAERAQHVRAELAREWEPVVVLYASGVIPGAIESLEVAVVFLRPRRPDPSHLRIFRMPRRPDPPVVEDDLLRLLRRQGGRGQFGYVIRDGLSAGDSLAFDRHDPEILARREDLSGYGALVRLGQIFEMPRPSLRTSMDRDLFCDSNDDGAVRVLTGRDIRRDGSIAEPDDQSKWARIPPDSQVRPGDLLLRKHYAPTDRSGLIVGEVTEDDVPGAGSESVIVLRATRALDHSQRLFATLFLRSVLARTLLRGAGGTGLHLHQAALRDMPVPQPDEPLASALTDLTLAEERFRSWRSQAEALLFSPFLDESAEVARKRIVSAGRLLRLRADAATLLDDFGYTVRTRFPHPVAYRWRKVEANLSAGSTQDTYEAILETAEVLLCYAAHLTLAITREQEIELKAAAQIRDKLTSSRRGLGLGDWTSILEGLRGNAYRHLPGSSPLTDLRSLLADDNVNTARRNLSDRRNDQAHLRRVDKVDLQDAIIEAYADLTSLVQAAQFLSDWPLIHVTSVAWDSLTNAATVRYRELMGDHPVVPSRIMNYPANDLEQGSLYIMDASRRMHLLRPFLLGRECPVCKSWSTFHLDAVSRNNTVKIKSLEHGHDIEDATLVEPLRHVGLLRQQ